MAAHASVSLDPRVWQDHGYDLPLWVNMQPAGEFLSKRFHRDGVPAAMRELLQAGHLEQLPLPRSFREIAEKDRSVD